jgi:hypothetical protein
MVAGGVSKVVALRFREACGAVPDRTSAAQLDMTHYPYLPKATVAMTAARDYMGLLARMASGPTRLRSLLAHLLNAFKPPAVLRAYGRQGVDYPRYLLRLAERELMDRDRRMVDRRIEVAKFPAKMSLCSFDFAALPSLNKALERGDQIGERGEDYTLLGVYCLYGESGGEIVFPVPGGPGRCTTSPPAQLRQSQPRTLASAG